MTSSVLSQDNMRAINLLNLWRLSLEMTVENKVGHGSGPSMGRVGSSRVGSQNSPFSVGRVGSLHLWVGLGRVKKIGPMSNSGRIMSAFKWRACSSWQGRDCWHFSLCGKQLRHLWRNVTLKTIDSTAADADFKRWLKNIAGSHLVRLRRHNKGVVNTSDDNC